MPRMPRKTSRLPWNKPNPKRDTRSDERYHTNRWTRFSKWFRKTFPRCVECGNASEVVDHVVPARLGKHDFYDLTNMQPMCNACHQRKRATDDKQWNK